MKYTFKILYAYKALLKVNIFHKSSNKKRFISSLILSELVRQIFSFLDPHQTKTCTV